MLLRIFKRFSKILNQSQIKNFTLTQILMTFASVMEALSLILIGFVVKSLSDHNNDGMQDYSGAIPKITINDHEFYLLLPITALIVVTFSTIIGALSTWKIAYFSQSLGAAISNRLYKKFINKSWSFFLANDQASLINKLSAENERLTQSVIYPLLIIQSKLTLIFFLLAAMLYTNIIITLIIFGILGLIYLLIYRLISEKAKLFGILTSLASEKRIKIMSESFSGIREVKILRIQKYFIDYFKKETENFAATKTKLLVYAQMPKYGLEFLVFNSVIIASIVLYESGNDSSFIDIEYVVVFALAGLKLLPALNQIYGAITIIKGNVHSLDIIFDELSEVSENDRVNEIGNADNTIGFKKIIFNKVSLFYGGKTKLPVLSELTYTFESGKTIGITGLSGSGKSTLADLLLNLIQPSSGDIQIVPTDGEKHSTGVFKNLNSAYVSQSIFIFDDSIANNVAFGQTGDKINYELVWQVLDQVELTDIIQNMPDGIDTQLGERGLRLSGGQRQRISIARALYRKPRLLILDEATSSLDNLTETKIINNLLELNRNMTIIMIAHRLSTLKKCDEIIVLEGGRISDAGTFSELERRNQLFQTVVLN